MNATHTDETKASPICRLKKTEVTSISQNDAYRYASDNEKGRNFSLILIRVVTAVTLFAVLGLANVWLDTTTNTVLALGYRFGLIFLPLTLAVAGSRSLVTSLTFMAAGAALLSVQGTVFTSLIAACLFSYGAAISGYLIKNAAAQTKKGAANNRIAMNLGAFVAGLVIMLPFLTSSLFFWSAAGLIAICMLIAIRRTVDVSTIHVKIFEGQSPSTLFAWILVGTAMGMMLFGVFSVLPQTILKTSSELPGWYGVMIILNSAVVILGQIPSLWLIEKMAHYRILTISGFVIAGFMLLAFPDLFCVHTLSGAAIWVFMVSIAECAFGHIDYYSVRQKTMFIKEICVGLGAALTVGIMRTVSLPLGPVLVAITGTSFILIWAALSHKNLRNFD
jgi:hypothetical protein